MSYQCPTLFGVVYASRLFREVDETSQAYQAFRKKTEPEFNMMRGDRNKHVDALLVWLNKWGCRITKKKFDQITNQLITWFEKSNPKFPPKDLRLADLLAGDLDTFAGAYSDLLTVDEFGPTSAAKTLFAMRPHAAMPWDAAIQRGFKLDGVAPEKYREMLSLCQKEAKALIADAERSGVSVEKLPEVSGSSDNTIPWLLDKFHWITVTRRHRIPSCEELRKWASWACGEAIL